MTIIQGYLSREREDIKKRKVELEVALELIERGYDEKDEAIIKAGTNHSLKHLKIDINNLSMIGVFHWSKVSDKFYDRYYRTVREHDSKDAISNHLADLKKSRQ